MIRARTGRERGASALEFAFVLPMLLLVLFSIIEYSWFMMEQIVLVNAASSGARAGVKAREWEDEDPADMARKAVQASFWVVDVPDSNIEVNDSYRLEDDGARMIEVKVKDLAYTQLTGFLPDAMAPKALNATAVMAFP
ncbi:MAG: TadE/TadG family type IV pilus assembly protein [Syntrophobacteraceae bacterium]